eukprot:TRINITY_DN70824_c0_g1_i2.p1 TRINITY_DN70824_c0_g1~~TRINITY_DN70824_c0_g1_i2.p1  ORF type:complete len:493 (-),score=20.40 TRINITY_DN70824_c0_g1_i2:530-2008(-)
MDRKVRDKSTENIMFKMAEHRLLVRKERVDASLVVLMLYKKAATTVDVNPVGAHRLTDLLMASLSRNGFWTSKLTSRDYSQWAWSLAKSSSFLIGSDFFWEFRTLRLICNRAIKILDSFSAADCSMILWSLAKLRVPEVETFFIRIIDHMMQEKKNDKSEDSPLLSSSMLAELNLRQLALVSWCCGSMKIAHAPFYHNVGFCLLTLKAKEENFSAKHVAMLTRALSNSVFDDSKRLFDELSRLTRHLCSQSIPNLLLGFSTAKYFNSPIFIHLANVACMQFNKFTFSGITASSWSLAIAGIHHERFCGLVARRLSDRRVLQEMALTQIAITLWALATVGFAEETKTQQLLNQIAELLLDEDSDMMRQISLKSLANILWSLAILSTTGGVVIQLVGEVIKRSLRLSSRWASTPLDHATLHQTFQKLEQTAAFQQTLTRSSKSETIVKNELGNLGLGFKSEFHTLWIAQYSEKTTTSGSAKTAEVPFRFQKKLP